MSQDPDRRPRSRASLRQLEAFCAVSLGGSVSAAATRLARTQSAISMALSELETALGAPLFERAGRRLRPTAAARRLLPRAIEIVERAAELPALATDTASAGIELSIGASRTIGPFVIPEMLDGFLATHPPANLELAVANTGDLLARIWAFTLDVAFVEGEVLEPGLEVVPWLDDELALFARAGHPVLSARGEAAIEALRQASWALREPGSGTREVFLRALAPLVGSPRVGIQVSDPLTLIRLVAGGDWLGCLSRRAIAGSLRDGTLAEIPPPRPSVRRALKRRFWIVRHPQRYRTRALDALLAHARAWARPAQPASSSA